MTLRTPPSWLQNGSHTAENDRLSQQAIYATTGIVGSSSLQVTAQSTPNMTVAVAAGWAAIVGANTTTQGVYLAYNDASVNVTITSNSSGSTRYDRVVLTVSDAYYSGSTNTVTAVVVAGTPGAGTPPSTPTNSISLATIQVANGASSIGAGVITDTRVLTTTNLPVLSLSGGTLTGSLTAPGLTLTGAEVLAVGTASLAPLKFQAGTNLTTATGGVLEYDGTVFYGTPNSSATNTTNGGRGVALSSHVYVSSSQYTVASPTTSAQPIYAATGSSLALAAGVTYEVEGVLRYSYTTGATAIAPTFQIAYSGTSTAAFTLDCFYLNGASPLWTANYGTIYRTTATSANLLVSVAASLASTTVLETIMFKGFIRPTTAGSLTPQIAFSSVSSLSGVLSLANSSFKVTPVGSSSVTSVGAWA